MYSFDQIAGNEQLIAGLQSFIKLDKVPHAIIFSGAAGMGKKLIANTYAKALLCEEGNAAPCDACLSCRTFNSGNNSDVIYVSATKTKSISVDDIREQVGRNVYIKPYSAARKIFIINNADTMTVQAQNSMLKTLEDSPSYAIFLLLTQSTGQLRPTILSRCILYKLNRVPLGQMRSFLLQSGIPSEKAELLCIFSEGNLGRALALNSDEDFIAMRNLVIETAINLPKLDFIKIFTLSKEFERYKDRIQEALDIFLLWYRDLLVAKTAAHENLLALDLRQNIIQALGDYTLKQLCDRIKEVQAAKDRLSHYANFQLTIEVLLINLSFCYTS